MKKVVLRFLLSLTSAALAIFCTYAFLRRGQDVIMMLPLYACLVPLLWILNFTAVFLKPYLWGLLVIPYAAVVITNIVYYAFIQRSDGWLTGSSWAEPGLLLGCLLLGMSFIGLFFYGIRQLREKRKASGLTAFILSLVLVLVPIIFLNGNPVSAIQAKRSLDAWREEHVDEELHEVRGFHYNWTEGDFFYELRDRENGKTEWLHYLPAKNGKAPEILPTWKIED